LPQRGYLGSASAKFLKNVIDRDQDLMGTLDVFFIVRSVFMIVGEWRC